MNSVTKNYQFHFLGSAISPAAILVHVIPFSLLEETIAS